MFAERQAQIFADDDCENGDRTIFQFEGASAAFERAFCQIEIAENESVAEFFERRLGREIVERAAIRLCGNLCGNPENLSVKAAFFRDLYELEKNTEVCSSARCDSKQKKAVANFRALFVTKRRANFDRQTR
jgi:protoporphyrinogen oxidase